MINKANMLKAVKYVSIGLTLLGAVVSVFLAGVYVFGGVDASEITTTLTQYVMITLIGGFCWHMSNKPLPEDEL